ncbi:hypothetical protein P872_20050 [Rhodonellum psychrophilum GCM71 = DSM 17998]|uniref:Amidohydrolase-related domain-containing protein n=2 Tax=Rhodonellum TaxID=336827 RepID=U5BY61_9BACT|nr:MULTISPECIES: amidohydrolase family protein [Rhodonellum]ERM81581.1 hypothetical protein P872_20050 [Rhodonellum psychrophilum GCM71 = DSM 17998]SDZ37153.1 Imidazolonepropionase [Rhodonellum ikkaensis]
MNINPNIKLFGSLLILVLCTSLSPLIAQSDPTGEKRVTGTYAITNATITTAPGKSMAGATILIKDGLIHAVGTNLSLPAETQLIKADSLFIYPGFIDGASNSGITKPNDPQKGENFNPSDPSDELAGITPWRQVMDHFDPKSNQIADWRKTGFTIAQLIPDGGMLTGKSAIVVFGNSKSSNVLAQNTGLYAKFRGSRGTYPATTLGVMAKFRDLYKNAELSAQHARIFASAAGLTRPEINKTYEAFYPVLDKNIPILFEVADDLEIRRALSLQKELGFRMVLVGVTDVDRVIDEIKGSDTKILLSLNLPDDKAFKDKKDNESEDIKSRLDRVKAAHQNALKQAGILEKAGVKFGFITLGAKSGDMMKNIRLMVANGLSEDAALAALTINNAEILNIQKFTGTLEKGKLANLIISTKPIFAEEAEVKYVMADGYLFDYDLKAKNKGNGIEGVWEYTSETPAGSSGGTIEIKKGDAGYTGTITYDDPAGTGKASTGMNSITYSDNTLSFNFEVPVEGNLLKVNVTGEIKGGSFEGNLSIAEYGSFPMKANKKPNL